MTYIHPELNAYDTISRDIETNFHTHIGKTKDDIDLLQVDVQGAELEVLKGTNLNNVKCLFLEIQKSENKHQIVYEGQCFMDDIEKYLGESFVLHSIGLDNDLKNGTGNGFWVKI